ncbi:MAG: biotin--[acetyl-CoA-carboxylase] ligase [Chitinophagaceae bacterium]|nr:biotin--[acetyl-CoA-carboxylase] ligase [Chitinophagaceae bacterium]
MKNIHLLKNSFIGKNIIHYNKCTSTNTVAAGLLALHSLEEGTIVITDEQTEGRGQSNNYWESEPQKNLCFTIVLYPTFLHTSHIFYLHIITSLSIRDALQKISVPNLKIKWTNDIFCKDKKISGILIENTIQQYFFSQSLIGIGININQKLFSIPSATSVIKELSREYDILDILTSVLENIEMYYLHLKSKRYESLKKLYLRHLYWKDELHLFKNAEGMFEGIITGIKDSTGQLAISVKNKEIFYHLKEIVFIK